MRRARDYYPTPAWCLHRLCDDVDLGLLGAPRADRASEAPPISSAWEPAAGRGHLVRALRQRLPRGVSIDATDVEPAPEHVVQALDFVDGEYTRRADLIITNPPYILADDFVRRALGLVTPRGSVAMLLRITWLGGGDDAHPGGWLRARPPSVYVLPERPRFDGVGTDSAPSAWCVWRPSGVATEFRVLAQTPVEVRRRDEDALSDDVAAIEARCAPSQGSLF